MRPRPGSLRAYALLVGLKHKKAPLAPTAGCRCEHPAALKASLKGALEDEVVVDPGADADELALLAALPVSRHGVCAIGGALVV